MQRAQFRAMGSPCELQLFAESAAEARACADAVVREVARLEQRYSRFRADSFLSEINRTAAAGGSIAVDDETASLFDYAVACHRESDGLFDVTSGILRQAWRRDGGLPDPAHVRSLLTRVGWHRLEWSRPTLAFPEPGLEIDFGGVVKEYAADRAAAVCRARGVGAGMINLGGDVCIIGPRPDGTPWRIGVRDPRQRGATLRTLLLHEGAVASSGDYERCIEVGGVRYGHILDPRTGWPVRHLAAVSAVAPLCVVAGSASTIAILRAETGPEWLESTGLPHLWVDVRGRTGGPLLGSTGSATSRG
jgi:thiamine biosynthesis lipoprotein